VARSPKEKNEKAKATLGYRCAGSKMFNFGGFGLLYFARIIQLDSAGHRSPCPIIGHGSEVIMNAFQAAFSGSFFGRKILSSEKPVFIYSVG
jgi:hypothetical protein